MISNQVLQSTLDGIKNIARIDRANVYRAIGDGSDGTRRLVLPCI